MVLDAADEQLEGDIFLIPLRLEDCTVPDRLSRWQWVDYFQDPDRSYSRLLLSLDLRRQSLGLASTPQTGKQEPSEPSEKVSSLSTFEYEVFTVDSKGKVKDCQTKQAECWVEDLGNGVTLDMVKIPGGQFQMGSLEGEGCDRERPQRLVTVESFWMGKYPVTQVQWKAVAGFANVERVLYPNLSCYKGDNCPAAAVSWNDAVEFCARLSRHTGKDYRLSGEAEWEYACRSGTRTSYYFGEMISKDLANYSGHYERTTEVGKFGANAFGLYDMHGNVSEWCLDRWRGNYDGAPMDVSTWTEDRYNGLRVHRGGDPGSCRSASRGWNSPDIRVINIGFRVCCSPPRSLP